MKSDYQEIIGNIGLNCLDPSRAQQNYVEFYEEITRLFKGAGGLGLELALLTGTAKDYPNLCNVFTDYHANTYSEKDVFQNKNNKGLFSVSTYSIDVEYYWPKYLIEVTESGSSPASIFTKNNVLYGLSRKVGKLIDTSEIENKMGQIKTTLFSGMNESNSFITKFNKMRLTGNNKVKSYEANIWPIALAHEVAKEFTVCGPTREKLGYNAGGVKWPFSGVPMTCPIATTQDAAFIWDTGVMDLIAPDSLAKLYGASDPRSCAIDHVRRATQSKVSGKLSSLTPPVENFGSQNAMMRKALFGCSYPVSSFEAIFNNLSSTLTKNPLNQIMCTPWGQLYPRTGKVATANDYVFANTALKFKSLSNDVFGVELGAQEKISSFLPFDERSYGLYEYGDLRMIDSSASPDLALSETSEIAKSATYASAIAEMDSASALATEVARQEKLETGGVNVSGSRRRIYTVWEKINCVSPVRKQVIRATGAATISKYESCQKAIRLEVYKLFQRKYLRKICDLANEKLGGGI
ncbi:hypothetical protein [Halobacteriovorax sp. ZH2_bin.1]